MFKKFFLFSLGLLLASISWAHAAPTESSAIKKRTHKTIQHDNSVKKNPIPSADIPSNLGYLLIDLESGQTLDSFNDQKAFIPASVAKVPSTLAALHILGSSHRFTTTLQAMNSPVNGVLSGDLVLVGSGDPSFSMAGLMDLALQLRLKGVNRIQGRFLYDESALLAETNISAEQNEEETYNQGISALSLENNRIQLNWSITPSGQLLTKILPNLNYISLVLGPASKVGPSMTYLGDEKGESWRLNPRKAHSGWDWLPIKKPGRYTALVFKEICHKVGINLPSPEPGQTNPKAITLAKHASRTLDDMIDATLEHSNNLWTELIGMTAASRLTGQPQTKSSAAKILGEWLTRQLPQTDWKGFHLTNNSGLSASSRISPRQMVEIL
ncbi:MAG: D-alanyl-D-alanine carboxypeptidase/D-alanyl-D-alanine-endopeptidase, partial [Magnetococcales bacterium]|nr:D-alanyl-D-alanine carboxypeptidase/D-alanyl-D-alanine-endopeptidase [Magnetococcales bacterium]